MIAHRICSAHLLRKKAIEMTNDLATLTARIGALEDRESIRELIATYGTLADCGDAQALAQLWCDDGEYEVAGFATAKGHDAIAALIDAPYHRALMASGCAHALGTVTVDIDGDCATARGHSVVFRHSEGRFEALRVAANRWTLVRTQAGWRVAHRANALLDGTFAARMLLAPAQPAI